MQIYCPKCKTGYEIEASVIPEEGRKLRCAVCQKVFMCMPEDLIDGSKLRQAEFTEEEKEFLDENKQLDEEAFAQKAAEEIIEVKEDVVVETSEEEAAEAKNKTLDEMASDNQYVKDIFKRLSTETEALFEAEKKENPGKKYLFKLRKMLGLSNLSNIKYYFIGIAVLLLLVAYYARYEIVRKAPFLGPVYEVMGIDAVVVGEGLEFQNVVRREYEEDYVPKVEIKGFIANQTDRKLDIPAIRIELLDKDAKLIQYKVFSPVIPIVTERAKVPFKYVLKRPSPLTKYIYLTFVEEKK